MAYKSELEALILGALRETPLHGYAIVQTIRTKSEGLLKMGDNQIYPILHRLEAEGLVSAEWEPQTGKPSRKVYALTPHGQSRLEKLRQEWDRYVSHIAAVIGLGSASNA